MENYLSRITINTNQLDGKPCIRGIRISLQTILEFLSAGDSETDIIEHYPLLKKKILPPAFNTRQVSGKEINFQITDTNG